KRAGVKTAGIFRVGKSPPPAERWQENARSQAGGKGRRDYSVVAAAGFDWPEGFDAPFANRHAAPVQVHRGAAMGRYYFAPVADPDRGVLGIDVGVLFGKARQMLLGSALDDGRAEIARNRLAARVEHIPVGPPADDGRQDRQGAAEFRPNLVIGTVHE